MDVMGIDPVERVVLFLVVGLAALGVAGLLVLTRRR